jgi:hypothetical protein
MSHIYQDSDSSLWNFRTRTPSDVLRMLDKDRALLVFDTCMGNPDFRVTALIGAEVKFSLRTRDGPLWQGSLGPNKLKHSARPTCQSATVSSHFGSGPDRNNHPRIIMLTDSFDLAAPGAIKATTSKLLKVYSLNSPRPMPPAVSLPAFGILE